MQPELSPLMANDDYDKFTLVAGLV